MERELPEERGEREAEHDRLALKRDQGAERIGARDPERASALLRQALGQHEHAVEEVQRREPRRGEEGRARAVLAEEAAERRAEHEAEPERSADHREALRALVGRR